MNFHPILHNYNIIAAAGCLNTLDNNELRESGEVFFCFHYAFSTQCTDSLQRFRDILSTIMNYVIVDWKCIFHNSYKTSEGTMTIIVVITAPANGLLTVKWCQSSVLSINRASTGEDIFLTNMMSNWELIQIHFWKSHFKINFPVPKLFYSGLNCIEFIPKFPSNNKPDNLQMHISITRTQLMSQFVYC